MLTTPLIDGEHRNIALESRKAQGLIAYLVDRGLLEDGPFWKLARALFEILPWDLEDRKLVNALVSECETLRIEGKCESFRDTQRQLDL